MSIFIFQLKTDNCFWVTNFHHKPPKSFFRSFSVRIPRRNNEGDTKILPVAFLLKSIPLAISLSKKMLSEDIMSTDLSYNLVSAWITPGSKLKLSRIEIPWTKLVFIPLPGVFLKDDPKLRNLVPEENGIFSSEKQLFSIFSPSIS